MSQRAFAGLLLLACLQLAALALGLESVGGFALATAASPAPKVFTSQQGLEPFSSRYAIVLEDVDGRARTLELTSERYAALEGPYNRRNPYGAVLAFAPGLSTDPRTRNAFFSVARHALCGRAPLLAELGVSSARLASTRTIVQLPRSATHTELPLSVEVTCP
jgi:hypothetical protein